MNLFNAALVTPTYYVYFTSSTIVASSVLFRGFKGTQTSIATIIMGFLVICSGVVLLQLSKSAKDVPDTAVLKGDLDQIRTVGEQEQPESEPKADALRGTAAIIRRLSQARQKWEAEEARKVYQEKLKDQMEPISENEIVEWDGLRRRKTVVDPSSSHGSIQRRKTLHPPLGLTKFPSYDEDRIEHAETDHPQHPDHTPGSFFSGFRRHRGSSSNRISINPTAFTPRPDEHSPIPEAESVSAAGAKGLAGDGDAHELRTVLGLPPGLRSRDHSSGSSPGRSIAWADAPSGGSGARRTPELLSPRPHTGGSGGRRQFSFQNVLRRKHSHDASGDEGARSPSPRRAPSPPQSTPAPGSSGTGRSRGRGFRARRANDGATEEERLGLVKGDSNQAAAGGGGLAPDSPGTSPASEGMSPVRSISEAALPLGSAGGVGALPGPWDRPAESEDVARYEAHRQKWSESSPELLRDNDKGPL